MDDNVAGTLLFLPPFLYTVTYLPLMVALYRLARKQPSFAIFLSCSIGDFTGMLQFAVFGASLLLKVDLIPRQAEFVRLINGVIGLFMWVPMQYHYVSIALMRCCAIVFFGKFKKWFDGRNSVLFCVATWLVCLALSSKDFLIPKELMFNW